MNRHVLALALIGTITGLLSAGANAAIAQKTQVNQASGTLCQGALPNYEGSFRKRPLAVVNEGTASAFITCGLNSESDASTHGDPAVELVVTNRNAVATNMNCTLVDGYVDSTIGFTDFFPQVLSVSANDSAAFLWDASSAGGSNAPVFNFPAISCNVAPHMEINLEAHLYNEEIGA